MGFWRSVILILEGKKSSIIMVANIVNFAG